MTRMTRSTAVACALAAAVAGRAASATELLVDGGFEDPAATSPGYQSGYANYFPTQTFGGPSGTAWTVIGSDGDVAVTNTGEYTGSSSSPTFYNAHSGAQWLDLTGSYDTSAPIGVEQTVATVAGQSYALSFWLGTFVDAPSGVRLYIDGTQVGSYLNPVGGSTPGLGNSWLQVTLPVVAAGSSTTIGFLYGGGVSVDGIDDVSFQSNDPGVPEPATWAMLGAGFGLTGAALRRTRTPARA